MVQPVAGMGAACGNGGLTGEPGGVVELQTERGCERRRIEGGDVVGRDTATGTEVAEVERRPVDAPLRPPAHSIWATFLPPRSVAWASVSACSTPAVPSAEVLLANGWPLTWNVLFVEPATPGHAPVVSVNHPAPVFGGACVEQPVVGRLGPVLQQVAEAGHDTLLGVLLDGVLAQAIGREEQQLVRAVVTVSAAATAMRRRGVDPDRRGEADEQRCRGDDRETTPTMPRRTNRLTG